MIKHLAFAMRWPYLPAWGKVNLHTSLGLIPAEYIPGTEIQNASMAWVYGFNILDSDVPSPGDFECTDMVEPYVTPYSSDASCNNCFSGIETVNTGGVEYIAAFVPNQCGGRVCLVMVPKADICDCEGGGGDPPDLSGYAELEGGNAFTGNQGIVGNVSITGNISATGIFSFTGNSTFGGGEIHMNGRLRFSPFALISGPTVNWDTLSGNYATLVLGESATLANPTSVECGTYILRVTQGAGGGHTLAYGSNFRFPGGTPPVLSTLAGAEDILTFVNFGGDDLYLIEQLNFTP